MSLRSLGLRLLAAVPTVAGVVFVVFFVVHLIPGDAATAILGESATAEQLEMLRAQLGLDQPILTQFLQFLTDYLTGNLGTSLVTHRSVADEILAALGGTVVLAVAGVTLSVLLGVPIGVLAAVRRGKVSDYLSQLAATVGVAVPTFWLGLLLVLFFAVNLGWFPSIGSGTPGSLPSMAHALVLPAIALALPGMALVTRMTRAAMLEVLGEDYIRTATAKGLSERSVLYKHALRNAAIPILTVVSLNFGNLLGGAIVIETVFARHGLGKLLLDSILNRDFPVVQGVCFVIAVSFVLVNVLTDLLYQVLDPRVSHA